MLLIPIRTVDALGDDCSRGGVLVQWVWAAEWVLWKQNTVPGRCGGVACQHMSQLLACPWGLHHNSSIPPEMGAQTGCLSGTQMGGRGEWDVPWSSGLRNWAQSVISIWAEY